MDKVVFNGITTLFVVVAVWQKYSLDFLSVALHEVGHVLGFTSGLDDGEWLNVVTEARDEGKEIKDDAMKFATPLDLFRYSRNGELSLSMGQNSYFSIDGGRTNLANFSTGEYSYLGGDGYQASHWKHNGNNVLGIMDPVLKLGVRRELSGLDTLAMDVIGWNVRNPGQFNWQNIYADAVRDASHAWIENRDKDVEKMVKESETYKGRRGSSGGSWQVGFWQNIKFQTLDVEVQSNDFHTESNAAQMFFDNFVSYVSPFDSSLAPQNKSDNTESENKTSNEFVVEEVIAAQLMENEAIVDSEI